MKQLRRHILIGAVIVGAVVAGSPALSAQRPRTTQVVSAAQAQRDGWWIRVNPSNEASNLYWRFGAEPNRLGSPIAWAKGKNPETADLPANQRGLETIHLAALAMPATAHASFCVFFQDQGVALFEFTGEKTGSLNRDSRAPECQP